VKRAGGEQGPRIKKPGDKKTIGIKKGGGIGFKKRQMLWNKKRGKKAYSEERSNEKSVRKQVGEKSYKHGYSSTESQIERPARVEVKKMCKIGGPRAWGGGEQMGGP